MHTNSLNKHSNEGRGVEGEPAGVFARNSALVFSNFSKTFPVSICIASTPSSCWNQSSTVLPLVTSLVRTISGLMLAMCCQLVIATSGQGQMILYFVTNVSQDLLKWRLVPSWLSQSYNLVCCCLFFMFTASYFRLDLNSKFARAWIHLCFEYTLVLLTTFYSICQITFTEF